MMSAAQEAWPFTSAEALADVRANFLDPHGDRRQELVLIGDRLEEAALAAALDACLVDDDEWDVVQRVMADSSLDARAKTAALQVIFDECMFSPALPASASERS
jgi:hypothetical protein